MDTSGNGLANSLLYAALLWLAVLIGGRMRPHRTFTPGRPYGALALWAVVAVPSLLQLTLVPSLYDTLHRDPGLIVHHGQWWRVITAAVVQDGGLHGTLFNLASLAVVGYVGERVWGARAVWGLFAACALLMNLLGVWWNAEGGGNSGATFGLAMTLAGAALLRGDAGPVLPVLRVSALRVPAVLACGAAVALVALGDGHGVVALFGAACGAAAAGVHKVRSAAGRCPVSLQNRTEDSRPGV